MSDNSKRIAIVTDSTCDIPEEIRQKRDIYMVPLSVIWGEEALKDGEDITPQAFYKRLPIDPVHPQTSQPSVGAFANFYEQMKDDGAEEIVAVLISDELSGTITSAEGAKDMTDLPVHVVDSRLASLALGVVVLAAAEARDAGGDVAAIVAAAKKRAEQTKVIFAVDTLEYLHKGGRIGGAAKLIGTALNLKPVLTVVDGQVEALERVRTRTKALARMLEVAADGLDKDAPLGGAVIHANAPGEAAKIAERYKEMYSLQEFMISEVTPIIGVHTGPNVIGVVCYNL
jgi:DegV family protein with EDD domain